MRSLVPRLSRAALAAVVLASVAAAPAAALPRTPHAAIIQPGNTIVVNDGGDQVADDGVCTLREAVTAANDNLASGVTTGECAAGSPGEADTITFKDLGAENFVATIADDLPQITSGLIIDGVGGATISAEGSAARPFDVPAGVTLTVRRLFVTSVSTTSLGGAMLLSGTAVIDRSYLQTSTDSRGGVVRVAPSGSLTVVDSTLNGFADLGGGSIWNEGTTTISRSTLYGWAANDGGGGVYNTAGATLTIDRSLVRAEAALGAPGGGIMNLGTATVSNSVMSGNRASTGGGAIRDQATLTLAHVTILQNEAEFGGGISTTSAPVVTNSAIVGNTGGDVDGTFDASSVGNVTELPAGTTIDDWFLLSDEPAPLLVAGSPFVDTANDAACAAAPVSRIDIRGLARPAGACDIGAVERDKVAPSITVAPRVSFRAGQQLSGSSAQARVSWGGTDTGGTGIIGWQVEMRVDGGPWMNAIASDIVTSLTYENVTLVNGKSYRFRALAYDKDQNTTAWSYGPTFTARLVQQTSSAITYRGTWTRAESTRFSGGSVRYAKARGASASYTATGRAYTFVTTTGPNRGKARIYVNGVLKATVDLSSPTYRYRVQAWQIRYSTSASRTIRVVVLGTSGRPRVDLDAFYVMR